MAPPTKKPPFLNHLLFLILIHMLTKSIMLMKLFFTFDHNLTEIGEWAFELYTKRRYEL